MGLLKADPFAVARRMRSDYAGGPLNQFRPNPWCKPQSRRATPRHHLVYTVGENPLRIVMQCAHCRWVAIQSFQELELGKDDLLYLSDRSHEQHRRFCPWER